MVFRHTDVQCGNLPAIVIVEKDVGITQDRPDDVDPSHRSHDDIDRFCIRDQRFARAVPRQINRHGLVDEFQKRAFASLLTTSNCWTGSARLATTKPAAAIVHTASMSVVLSIGTSTSRSMLPANA